MTVDVKPPERTVKQIVGADGKPLVATATSNVWILNEHVFSHAQEGNKIIPFVTGADYYADLILAIKAAETEICILGWQVNWDAMLAPGVRLYDVLLRAALKKTMKRICVMPWDDAKPMLTYDTQTKAVLESINSQPGVNEGCVEVLLSKTQATKNGGYFSQHQKQVIIDRKIAYVGGIDIAYGRYDDAKFELKADADKRTVLNRYNPCIPSLAKLDPEELVDADLLTGFSDSYLRGISKPSKSKQMLKRIEEGGMQMPYATPSMYNIGQDSVLGVKRMESNTATPFTLDPSRQPRMPWQDVHSRVEGPSVSDLLRNFVVRWNASGGERLAMPAAPSTYDKPGNAHIQVLRSAPAAMRAAELKAGGSRTTGQSAGTENDIYLAMLQLIEKSNRFIYIESQFFVSGFGQQSFGPNESLSPAAEFINKAEGKDQNSSAGKVLMLDADTKLSGMSFDSSAARKPPSNKICAALVKRIERAILDAGEPNYHVYITLPVHPEGSVMSAASIAVQVYWTMQTVAFGSNSLLTGIRRALKAKELLGKKDKQYRRVIDDLGNKEYESIPVEACFKYVTLLNLRNWAKLGDDKHPRYVTEQVYVHTKLMIVDDLYALLGSANINDRSLLGERDSEIAILVMDGDSGRADICGKGSQRPIRNYAHNLRKMVWNKLFGITGNVRPASHLKQAIEQPGIPDSWRSIQKQADANAAAYEAAFTYIPKNWTTNQHGEKLPASIIPNWNPLKENPRREAVAGFPSTALPFQAAFYDKAQHESSGVSQLNQIKGFFTALPIHWTKGEMLRFDFPTSMVAHNDIKINREPLPETPALAVAGVRNTTASQG
jgi:phospholipase D1/2